MCRVDFVRVDQSPVRVENHNEKGKRCGECKECKLFDKCFLLKLTWGDILTERQSFLCLSCNTISKELLCSTCVDLETKVLVKKIHS